MKKFLVPAALALTLAMGGSAFAASMSNGIDLSLYQETSPFTVVKAPAFTSADYWQSADRNAQRASTAPMQSHGWSNQGSAAANDSHGPE